MPELPGYYTTLFHAVEKAIQALDIKAYDYAKSVLIQGQMEAENAYLDELDAAEDGAT